MLITSAEIPFASNASAAISASHTKCPVATMLRQSPLALLLKGSSAGVKLATTGVQNANKQGHDDQQEIAVALLFGCTGIN
jgi:hypothetical protein